MYSKFVNVGLFITKVINEKTGFKNKSCQGYENQIFDSMKRILEYKHIFHTNLFLLLKKLTFKMEKKAYSCVKQVWEHFTKLIVSNVFTFLY